MVSHPTDRFEPLISSSDPSFDRFYGIYSESMPVRERKPKAEITAMVGQPHYKILLLKRAGTAIGFSIIFAPVSEMFCLLEYMAIDVMYRSSGLGRTLFTRSILNVIDGRGFIPVLLEVDSEREPSGDMTVIKRRLDFYRRLGCLRIQGLSYVLPLPGEGPPPAMDLLVYFHSRTAVIRRSELERWLRVVYMSVYNCSPEDPRLAMMTSTLSDPVVLTR